ncbi:valine--tRNA ligase [Candidatus Purcelliella pentastirinorum]|uniref:Valine--tRNA ligase n=1 Tax=Candidatus Purcelliella pentastirinorum TaxID=472834 RepID=A0AAX3N9A5_9ENTR|nr:valine--tRNA ligase [Candidatus Purcelliella pentastirinorum]WDI78697.1 valine--tRNA ligase [Candidatus Purcelliella pentastirinorum]WDR80691.1 valine--tRNA ligase [Candidatus Purcelliella pentastirinorum]
MKKKYDPNYIEKKIYSLWEKNNYFKFNKKNSKKKYCITLPPPNITGTLHMGHAFQHTLMDILIRYNRMKGKNTLWQIGIDHAGIATQILITKKIIKEGYDIKNYDKNAFIKKILKWKKKYGKIIKNQMKRLGYFIDWNRERFTMDKKFSYTVRKVFINLYKNNLIYKTKSIVNWDTELNTVISDLEIKHKNKKVSMWYIKYKLLNNIKTKDGKKYLLIGTTRPETIFGDTAIMINPEDKRYNNLIGYFVKVPLINRIIPIISDIKTDIKKGSGCVKITPAHDFNDYKIAIKYNLPMINIFTYDGKMLPCANVFDSKGNTSIFYSNKIPKSFHNLDRYVARKKIIKKLKIKKLLKKEYKYNTYIPYNERSGAIIEPMLTNQWYIKTKKLTKLAINAVKNGNINFIHKQYKNIYFSWMKKIKDWCISRQIWWGHRIPVWYDKKNNIYVGQNEKKIRLKYKIPKKEKLKQDDDVLDTWFSASMWTFSSLGWPKSKKIFKQYHPTDVIVSGFDIIFFWIARMIMITMYIVKDKKNKPQIPFKNIYITGLICDENGEKMSKSKGNIVDPIDIINGISLNDIIEKRTKNMIKNKSLVKIINNTKKKFPYGIKETGADPLRFTITSLSSTSRLIKWDMNRLEGYKKFCNKLWNASKFVINKSKNIKFSSHKNDISIIDKWIISELNIVINEFEKSINNYRFDIIANKLYSFIWNQYCDWYIEFVKPLINICNENNFISTINTSLYVLKIILKLAHPIIPFITEYIWQKLMRYNLNNKFNSITMEKFPKYNNKFVNKKLSIDIIWLKNTIIQIRNFRAKKKIRFNKKIKIIFKKDDFIEKRIKNLGFFIKKMVNIKEILIITKDIKSTFNNNITNKIFFIN